MKKKIHSLDESECIDRYDVSIMAIMEITVTSPLCGPCMRTRYDMARNYCNLAFMGSMHKREYRDRYVVSIMAIMKLLQPRLYAVHA
jgi:hypothetical protein